MFEQRVSTRSKPLLAIVPAIAEAQKSKIAALQLAKFWTTPVSTPGAKRKIRLIDEEECDKALLPHKPTDLWSVLEFKMKPDSFSLIVEDFKPVPKDTLRVVAISDTHEKHNQIKPELIPEGDILIHGGDISLKGNPRALASFREWIGKLPHKYKVVIAGNHDVTLDVKMKTFTREAQEEMLDVPEFIYLQEDFVEVEGYKIYGSPVQPFFGGWAFQKKRGSDCRSVWKQIPEDTDILITHGPPLGYGDLCKNGIRAGCFDLLREVQMRIKPLVHIFGHIHEDYGVTTDGQTLYVNASTCNFFYKPLNPAIVFDIPRR